MSERVTPTRSAPASRSQRSRRRSFVATYLTPKRSIPRPTVLLLSVVGFVVLIGLWWLVAALTADPTQEDTTQLIPRPDVVVRSWVDMVLHLGFLGDVGWSTFRILAG